MKTFRVIAVGLLAAAAMMVEVAEWFFVWWTQSVPFHAFGAALETMSPSLNTTTGYGGVALAVLVLSCLGFGLLASSTIYGAIDTRVTATLIAWSVRHEDSDFAQYAKVKYLPKWAYNRR